ncbi:DUF1801 domain-containing protein [bacterium SCSIO 12741]|nr:DUF1801 domain-containing protein [bacterium SCSIO 12741]
MTQKKTLVNAQTDASVTAFLNAVENEKRKSDAFTVLEMMKEITGENPKMWGKSIVGFGSYSYQRKNGDEFEWFNVGLSPAKAHLSVYVMYNLQEEEEMLERLGKHKKGKGCLYIKKLEDIDLEVLKEVIQKSDRWSQ